MSKYNVAIIDNDGDRGTTTIPVSDTALDAELQAFYDAVDGLSVGTMSEGYITEKISKQVGSDANAASAVARKHNIFVVRYQEATYGKKYSFSIPCADMSLVPGTNDLDIAAGAGLALVNAFEAIAESEFGSACTVLSIELKSRAS
jgi:hypothetical protein